MSLKGFHIVFIICSLLLSLGVAVYCLWVDLSFGEPIYQTGMIVSFLCAAAFLFYGIWFYRKMKRLRLFV